MKWEFERLVYEESDISDSEIDEYKEVAYKLLKFRTHKVKAPNGKFKCPFCADEEEEFEYTLLLQHAIQVADGSINSAKRRANHSAMATYLATDLAKEAEPSPQSSMPLQASESNDDFKNAMDSVQKCYQRMVEKLKEKEESGYFISKAHRSDEELQDIRIALITLLKEVPSQSGFTPIGIKRMGELDQNPFLKACDDRYTWYSHQLVHAEAAQLHSLWQAKMKDPHWHPFLFQVSKAGIARRVVNEDDESLKRLKKEWGEQICKAVVTALEELNNPSGCHQVPKLWNFNAARKATSVEVIDYIIAQLRTNQYRRCC